jgi:hypothetical protein
MELKSVVTTASTANSCKNINVTFFQKLLINNNAAPASERNVRITFLQ